MYLYRAKQIRQPVQREHISPQQVSHHVMTPMQDFMSNLRHKQCRLNVIWEPISPFLVSHSALTPMQDIMSPLPLLRIKQHVQQEHTIQTTAPQAKLLARTLVPVTILQLPVKPINPPAQSASIKANGGPHRAILPNLVPMSMKLANDYRQRVLLVPTKDSLVNHFATTLLSDTM